MATETLPHRVVDAETTPVQLALPTAAGTTTILLVRHAEVHNPERVLYGRQPNFRLSEYGVRQAERERCAARGQRPQDAVHRLGHGDPTIRRARGLELERSAGHGEVQGVGQHEPSLDLVGDEPLARGVHPQVGRGGLRGAGEQEGEREGGGEQTAHGGTIPRAGPARQCGWPN